MNNTRHGIKSLKYFELQYKHTWLANFPENTDTISAAAKYEVAMILTDNCNASLQVRTGAVWVWHISPTTGEPSNLPKIKAFSMIAWGDCHFCGYSEGKINPCFYKCKTENVCVIMCKETATSPRRLLCPPGVPLLILYAFKYELLLAV